jgi:hypothetical protein
VASVSKKSSSQEEVLRRLSSLREGTVTPRACKAATSWAREIAGGAEEDLVLDMPACRV